VISNPTSWLPHSDASASLQASPFDPLSVMMYIASAGVSFQFTATCVTPSFCNARWITNHSNRSRKRIPIRSPAFRPRAANASATRFD
jgi:hypothetical protein